MFVGGVVLLVVAAMALLGFFLQRHKSGRLGSTPLVSTGDAASKGAALAGNRGALAVQGKVQCAQPLLSPVTQTPCLYFELQVSAKWKVGESENGETLEERKQAAPVTVDDGSGPVAVVLSSLSDDDFKKAFDKTNSKGLLNVMDGNNLKFGDKGFIVRAGLTRDGRVLPDSAKYTVTEKILPVLNRAYVAGKAEGGKIIAPSWVSLIVSAKTREELLAGAASMMKRTKYVAIAAGVAGLLLVGVAAATGKLPKSGAPAGSPARASASVR